MCEGLWHNRMAHGDRAKGTLCVLGMFDRIAEYNGRLSSRHAAVAADPKNACPVAISKSAIHDWGLFARRTFTKGETIMEYVGERIRSSMADIREARYESGCRRGTGKGQGYKQGQGVGMGSSIGRA